MSRDAGLWLMELLAALQAVERFASVGRDAYLADELFRSAVERQLITAGEAAKHVPEAVRSELPDVDWQGMCKMRDFLTHVYFRIDDETVFEIAVSDVPKARAAIASWLDRHGRATR